MRRGLHALAAVLTLAGAVCANRASAEEKQLPDQFLGIQLHLTGGTFAGSGADKIAEPEMGFGGSLQVRLVPDLWLDLNYDQRIPVQAISSNGTMATIGVGQQTAGLRLRLPVSPTSNFVLGVGAGGAGLRHANQSNSPVFTGTVAYGRLGWEHVVVGGDTSGGYVGAEAVWNQYFVGHGLGFQGGLGEVHLTFSYYFGGTDASCCF